MSWKEVTTMSQRYEFIKMAQKENANIRELCRRYGITPRTGYKWIHRYKDGGLENLYDRSRCPFHSPRKTSSIIEENVLGIRRIHPAWGSRKIKARLEMDGKESPKSISTITQILRRNNCLDLNESKKHQAFRRFEMEQPNQLWQMDFKGYFAMTQGQYCHPLTVLDDHSRFLVGLRACPNQKYTTVQGHLTDIFRCFGLPERMLMDNGATWRDNGSTPSTTLTSWLMRLGISISHGRPYHPQTQGKDERLHRTLQEELLSRTPMQNLGECQSAFDAWRDSYNFERPHEALNMQPPNHCYLPSSRQFPENLPPILYEPGAIIRKVDCTGRISFRNHPIRVGKGFKGQPVAICPTEIDGQFQILFCHQVITQIDLINDQC